MDVTLRNSNPPDRRVPNNDLALISLASTFGLTQLALHLWGALSTRAPRIALMHALAWGYDLFLLATAVVVLRSLLRRSSGRWKSAANIAAKASLFALGLTLASYPLLLPEFLSFPINPFAVDASVTGLFLTDILGSRGMLVMVAVATLGLASLLHPMHPTFRHGKLLYGLLATLSLTGMVLSLAHWPPMATQPHPLIHGTQETLKEWFLRGDRVVPQPVRPMAPADPKRYPIEPSPLESAKTFRYRHVLILVMETVNQSDFADFFLGRQSGFQATIRDRSAYFDRYYTTNLDSYTSLLAMLTSVQVPYRAYEAPQYFAGLNDAPNMIGTLVEKGWTSLFVCTSEYQPFVPTPADWKATVHGHDLSNKEDWVSLGLNPVEAATEDKAAIPTILSFMENHPRTVIMHEMVFGHSPRWSTLTGKGQLEYYDEFFQELQTKLQGAGLADDTLWIIVADHGDRGKSTSAESYHVPLLVAGAGITPIIQSEMLCHLDLQKIVGHYLSDLTRPRSRNDVLVIGHTGRWVYGQITKDGQDLFIDALDGVVLEQKGNLSPKILHDRFQAEIDNFVRFQRTR